MAASTTTVKPPIEDTDPVGAQHLMSGEGGEVDAEGVEVDRLVRHRLAGIQHGQRTHFARSAYQLGHRSQRSEGGVR